MSKGAKGKGSNTATVAALVVGAVALFGLFGYAIYQNVATAPKAPQAAETTPGQQNQQTPPATQAQQTGPCWHSPVKVSIPGMETAECKTSNQHVKEGQTVTYDSDPPLSGQHWETWLQPGYYTKPQQAERLVHDLEHGNIVVYFNPDKISAEELEALELLVADHKTDFQGVVAVPRNDPKYPIILTAWEHALRLEKWDEARVNQFVDAFRGRGPEKPVR